MQAVDPEETDAIHRHLQHQRVYGPDRFRLAIERQLGRTLGPRKIGRPKKPVIETDDLSSGLPPLPRVDVCLHAGGNPEPAALEQLRRTVTEHALGELAGKKRTRLRQALLTLTETAAAFHV